MKKVHTIVWKEGKIYVAKALEVEVVSQGKSEQEALKNLQEALELYFEDNSTSEFLQIKEPKLQDLSVTVNA